jgi:undecaprenyl-diphosphatase
MNGTFDALRRIAARYPQLRSIGRDLTLRTFKAARAEFALLATIFVLVSGLWAFISLADEIVEGETEAFDRAVLLFFRSAGDPSDPIGPLWLEEAVRDVTALGGNLVLTIVTAAVIVYLLLARKRGAGLLVFVSVAGGTLLASLLKFFFQRARPDLVPHGAEVYTASFPSSHAMMSAVVYLTLGALLARIEVVPRLRLYFLALAALLTAMVGISRVYLGVHWPTDVVAGWAIGSAWAMLVWLIALWLQRRGRIEDDGALPADPPSRPSDQKTEG